MKKLFILILFLPCILFSQPFGQGGINLQSIDSLAATLTKTDSIVEKTTGHGVSFGSAITAYNDITMRNVVEQKFSLVDSDGDTVICFDPNATYPTMYSMDGSGADTVKQGHDGTDYQFQGDAGTGSFKFNKPVQGTTITDGTASITGGMGTGFVSMAVAGTLSGETLPTIDTDATIVLTASDCRNKGRINGDADAIDYTLPAAEEGLVVLFYDISGGVITIDPYDGTDTIYLNGVSVGAGDAIDSPGNAGDFIALWAIDDTRWITLGRNGIWTDGGAD
ncbi:hypothetical protein H8E88_10235 [candidate division KSB1 bacterium]|nr:hypothetical protein [candidate division KSB1 bacterium]